MDNSYGLLIVIYLIDLTHIELNRNKIESFVVDNQVQNLTDNSQTATKNKAILLVVFRSHHLLTVNLYLSSRNIRMHLHSA